MNWRIACILLVAVLAALGGGCRKDGYRLIVLNEGLHWATVAYTTSEEVEESSGTTYTSGGGETVELRPGDTLTRKLSSFDSVYVAVSRRGDGLVVFQEAFGRDDFKGPDHELRIVVRP